MLRRARQQQGVAVVTVIGLMVAMLAFAAVGTKVAISAASSAQRAKDATAARAAAESGIRVATFQLNQAQPSLVQCPAIEVGPDGKPTIKRIDATNPWCPSRSEQLSSHRSYTYAVKEGELVRDRCRTFQKRQIVSQGTSNGVRRTVTATVSSVPATAPLPNCGIMVRDDVSLINWSLVDGDVQSGGRVYLTDHAQICGNVTHPAGKLTFLQNASPPASVCGAITEDPGPVDIPQGEPPAVLSDLAATNSWVPHPVNNPSASCTSANRSWDAARKVLTLTGSEGCVARLELSGTDYEFCQINLNHNSELVFTSQAGAKLWIKDPNSCPGATQRSRINMNGNSRFINVSQNPSNLQLHGTGYNRNVDGTPSGELLRFELWSTSPLPQHLIINAPNYDISHRNRMTIVGSVAAQTYLLDDHARLQFSDASGSGGVVYNYAFEPRTWLECRAAPPNWSQPDQIC